MVENFLNWNGNFNNYNDYLNNIIYKLNKDLTDKKPWTLELNEKVSVLGEIMMNQYFVMCLMYPIIPSKIMELSKYFGWDKKFNLNVNIEEIYLNIPNHTTKFIAFEYIKT